MRAFCGWPLSRRRQAERGWSRISIVYHRHSLHYYGSGTILAKIKATRVGKRWSLTTESARVKWDSRRRAVTRVTKRGALCYPFGMIKHPRCHTQSRDELLHLSSSLVYFVDCATWDARWIAYIQEGCNHPNFFTRTSSMGLIRQCTFERRFEIHFQE